ncbi:unnamed protein product [Linum trigynum]|uniref:Uncharacterized protein n=1 Tax=Linum trigynum TaxID=586398 RepID=A0AAV2E091_9ROSI
MQSKEIVSLAVISEEVMFLGAVDPPALLDKDTRAVEISNELSQFQVAATKPSMTATPPARSSLPVPLDDHHQTIEKRRAIADARNRHCCYHPTTIVKGHSRTRGIANQFGER